MFYNSNRIITTLKGVRFLNLSRKKMINHNNRKFGSTIHSSQTYIKNDRIKGFGIGLCAGAMGAFVGLGGAFIVIPYLTGPLQVCQHLAHGTSMAAVVGSSFGACTNYLSASYWKNNSSSGNSGNSDNSYSDNDTTINSNGNSSNNSNKHTAAAEVDILSAVCVAITGGFAARKGGMYYVYYVCYVYFISMYHILYVSHMYYILCI